jgi:hypothetical protein
MRIRPATGDKLAVPAQQRRRRNERRFQPGLPRQHPGKRRQQHPIRLCQLRTSDLTLEHPQLVAEQQYLDLLLPLRTTPQHDQLKQPPQRPVEKADDHAPRPTRHRHRPYRSKTDHDSPRTTRIRQIRVSGTHSFRRYVLRPPAAFSALA